MHDVRFRLHELGRFLPNTRWGWCRYRHGGWPSAFPASLALADSAGRPGQNTSPAQTNLVVWVPRLVRQRRARRTYNRAVVVQLVTVPPHLHFGLPVIKVIEGIPLSSQLSPNQKPLLCVHNTFLEQGSGGSFPLPYSVQTTTWWR